MPEILPTIKQYNVICFTTKEEALLPDFFSFRLLNNPSGQIKIIVFKEDQQQSFTIAQIVDHGKRNEIGKVVKNYQQVVFLSTFSIYIKGYFILI